MQEELTKLPPILAREEMVVSLEQENCWRLASRALAGSSLQAEERETLKPSFMVLEYLSV